MLKKICFVGATDLEHDRGWVPDEVGRLAQTLGIETEHLPVHTIGEVERLSAEDDDVVFWPTGYTISTSEGFEPSIQPALDRAGVRYVGSSGRSVSFTSKVRMKAAIMSLETAGVQTPAWLSAPEDEWTLDWGLEPCVLKRDYGCDSQGVEFVNVGDDALAILAKLRREFGHGIFAEKWIDGREYTSAVIVTRDAIEVANLEILGKGGYPIIDARLKADNRLLAFELPDAATAQLLVKAVIGIVDLLKLDGYFRLDTLVAKGETFVIDLNFLPALSFGTPASYFVAAFARDRGWGSERLLRTLLSVGDER